MDQCCSVMTDLSARQRRVLQIVLVINGIMFAVELGAGLLAHSTALLADSADMLGDAIVYGFSLYVVGRAGAWPARAAVLKGSVMAVFGLAVLAHVIDKIVRGVVPAADLMGGVGAVALAANAVCLALLWRRRTDDVNMRSAWLCSLNDVASNIGVLLAAIAVSLTGSGWPDIAVGLGIAAMFGASAVAVLRDARRALRLTTTA